MNNQKQEVINALKDAQNVLVTVSKNPTVDQLAAAIGTTLVLNKLGKHGSAVYSGATPSTLEFLKPQETLEKNTDSLRDFIISLDKAKADKLRYKVEDQHVKIFITPYKTTIDQNDLEFSHGDFNVDVVLALGVHEQNELDQAITAHGRILHDAKIVSVNTQKTGELNGINLVEQGASSLSEVMTHISAAIQQDIFDEQIATALLTGIVAETDRFSNEKTTPNTMTASAQLMSAGANQQLVAAKLEVPSEAPAPAPSPSQPIAKSPPQEQQSVQETPDSVKHNDGSLEIKHEPGEQSPKQESNSDQQSSTESSETEEQNQNQIHVDEHGNFKSAHEGHDVGSLHKQDEEQKTAQKQAESGKLPEVKPHKMITHPPSSSTELPDVINQGGDESVDPLSTSNDKKGPILSHGRSEIKEEDKPTHETPQSDQDATESQSKNADPSAAEGSTPNVSSSQTLDSIEKAVDSPHQGQPSEQSTPTEPEASPQSQQPATPSQQPQEPAPPATEPSNKDDSDQVPDLGSLQNAVDEALSSKSGDEEPLEPIKALNANPVDLDLGHDEQKPGAGADSEQPQTDDGFLDVSKLDEDTGTQKPDETPSQQSSVPPAPPTPPAGAAGSPPPTPPPMMPPLPKKDDDGSNGDDLSLPPVPQ